MAKKSMVLRDKKRAELGAKYGKKREELKKLIKSADVGHEEKQAAVAKLNALPRDSSPSRYRNRCKLTGRSRGYYSKFGLGRNKLREAAMRGDIPGLTKASW